MKKLVLKNSLFVAVFAMLLFFICMPTQSHATETEGYAVLTGSLDGYIYSFDVADSVTTENIYVRAFTTVDVSGDVTSGEVTTNEVPINTVSVENGKAYVDFSGIWALFDDEATTVTCSVDYKPEGVDYMDYVVFNKIAVTETVDVAATEDTTFTYDVDTVMTPNVSDLELEELIDGDKYDNEQIQYCLDYLRDKTDLVVANEDAKDTFVWVNNKLVLAKDSKEASGNLVLAALASNLLEVAGLEDITIGTLKKSGLDYDKIMALINVIPLGVNIKEVAVSTKQYTASDLQYGFLLTPVADYFAGNTDSLTTILTTFEDDEEAGLTMVLNYLAKKGIFEESIVDISKCFTVMSFTGYKNAQEFVDGFNTMFNGLINQFIADVNEKFADDEILNAIKTEEKKEDIASALAYLYDQRIRWHGLFTSMISSSTPIDHSHWEAFVSKYTLILEAESEKAFSKAAKKVMSNFEDFAESYVVKATAYIDKFAADSATKLVVGTAVAFNHTTPAGVNTGDNNNFVLFTLMLVMALLSAAGVALKRN